MATDNIFLNYFLLGKLKTNFSRLASPALLHFAFDYFPKTGVTFCFLGVSFCEVFLF